MMKPFKEIIPKVLEYFKTADLDPAESFFRNTERHIDLKIDGWELFFLVRIRPNDTYDEDGAFFGYRASGDVTMYEFTYEVKNEDGEWITPDDEEENDLINQIEDLLELMPIYDADLARYE